MYSILLQSLDHTTVYWTTKLLHWTGRGVCPRTRKFHADNFDEQ